MNNNQTDPKQPEPPKKHKGMSVNDAKEYLKKRHEETILGHSWEEIQRMQQRK